MGRDKERSGAEQADAAADDREEHDRRRHPSPAEAAAGSAISGVPSLATHGKRGSQIEQDGRE